MLCWLFLTRLLYISFFQEKKPIILASSREMPITIYKEKYCDGIDSLVGLSDNKNYSNQLLEKREQKIMYENNNLMNVLNLLLCETNLHEKINTIDQNYDIFPPSIYKSIVSLPNIFSNLDSDEFYFSNDKQKKQQETFLDQDFYKLYFLLE